MTAAVVSGICMVPLSIGVPVSVYFAPPPPDRHPEHTDTATATETGMMDKTDSFFYLECSQGQLEGRKPYWNEGYNKYNVSSMANKK